MSPYNRRGTRYAVGSDTSRGPYPAKCELCGERVTVSGKDTRAAWFETDAAGVHRAFHHACRLALVKAAA